MYLFEMNPGKRFDSWTRDRRRGVIFLFWSSYRFFLPPRLCQHPFYCFSLSTEFWQPVREALAVFTDSVCRGGAALGGDGAKISVCVCVCVHAALCSAKTAI